MTHDRTPPREEKYEGEFKHVEIGRRWSPPEGAVRCRTCRGYHLPGPDLTDEQKAAQQAGQLDQRCRDCGAMSSASAFCYWCKSHDLEYRTHAEQGTGGPWCEDETSEPDPAKRVH